MVKKIAVGCALFFASLSVSFAGSFYVGPALNYMEFRADSANYQGVSPAIYAGYGDWVQRWWYLAGEVFGSLRPTNVGNNESFNGLSLKNAYTYGVSIVPAVNLDSVLVGYGRLGYIRAKFPAFSTLRGTYQIGAGIESHISDCWSLRGEFDYAPFTSILGSGLIRSGTISVAAIYRVVPLLG